MLLRVCVREAERG